MSASEVKSKLGMDNSSIKNWPGQAPGSCQSAEVADVVIRFVASDFEAGIARHVEGLAFAVGFPLALALELDATGAADAFHDFRRAGVEGQAGRQDHADRLLGAVGQHHGVADTLAIKVNIGILDHGHVVVLRHLNTPEFLNDSLGDETDHAKGQHEEEKEGPSLAGLGFPGDLADDEQHEEDEGANAPGREEIRDLLFVEPEYGTAFHRLTLLF